MTTISSRLLLGVFALLAVVPSSFAQQEPAEKKGPVAKIYIADAKGEGVIETGGKIYPIRQSMAFDAMGTAIEILAKSYCTIVYSNGTGLFVDENTRVEIERFVQQPFQPRNDTKLDTSHEPSMSHSNVTLLHGAIGIATNQLHSGSSMIYATPLASITIRGSKLVIEVLTDETHVDLLEGDVIIHPIGKVTGGQVLHPGERAVIRAASAPGLDPVITIIRIPDDARKKDELRVARAFSGRQTVTFEALAVASGENDDEAAGAEEIVARPTVPSDPPTNIVISPDRLPGT